MGLIEYLLIAIGAIAIAFLLMIIVHHISDYYRQQFNMSIWAGVFMLTVAVVSIAYSFYHFQSVSVPFAIVSSIILLLTGFLDIHHAGAIWGIVALLLQLILSALFIIVIISVIVLLLIRFIHRSDNILHRSISEILHGFENEANLFFRFFFP